MKLKEFNKKAVKFNDVNQNSYEMLEEDIFGVDITYKDNKLNYYVEINGTYRKSDTIAVTKEDYDFFLKILEKRVAAKNKKIWDIINNS